MEIRLEKMRKIHRFASFHAQKKGYLSLTLNYLHYAFKIRFFRNDTKGLHLFGSATCSRSRTMGRDRLSKAPVALPLKPWIVTYSLRKPPVQEKPKRFKFLFVVFLGF